MATKSIQPSRIKGGSDESRHSLAVWLRDVRRTVRAAGNRIRAVHPGIAYRVVDSNGRGLLWVVGSLNGSGIRFTEISA
jgi:hypothetical protein